DTSALAIDRVRRLKSAFEKLAPHQRQVIEMAYYEGMSQTEMAERLKQPLGTVKTWTRAALKILRDELAEAAIA
ncbi:MAG TPA: sigma-70 family RNA polymerase sigma factor, partial [Ktedonobacterales bacterium]|nr:sigma-70 family RNA polymerase sigma factor [Ktedonobacterales bacterium]